MRTLSILSTLLIVTLLSCCDPNSSDWSVQDSPIKTRWADDVKPGNTWKEYPRPHLQRNNWKNLNGLWEYAITDVKAETPDSMTGNILVPYPIESALSGVMKKVGPDQKIWYQRTVSIPAKLKSKRILLHFEAVDWEMTAWLDGEEIGSHRGGYDPFTFDITDAVEPGSKQTLLVSVWDPTTDGYPPCGKQTNNPHGIWYTPSSGIWQTVWMETVPYSFIDEFRAYPDIDQSQARIEIQIQNPDSRDHLEVDLVADKKLILTTSADLEQPIVLDIPEVKLWSPEDPFLYDLHIRLMRDETVVDEVEGYLGMRKISLGKDDNGFTRLMLNNQFVFQNGPLDQGFWPDGLNTPPSDEAMKYDIEVTIEMGFNMLRKHVKVEPRRFYYHTDKLGILVWQDMPSMYYGVLRQEQFQDQVEDAKANFETELKQLINDHFNHPSIVMWVPFNEGWGQHDTEYYVDLIKALDPTRLVNNASGWTDKGVGDVLDVHHYPEPIAPEPQDDRATVLGEFGGLGLYVPGHVWQEENWGYEQMTDVEDLLTKYENFYQEVFRLRDDSGLSACVYTQTTDVETETNGLMTYDRDSVKMGIRNIANAHLGKLPPKLKLDVTQFIDRYEVILTTPASGATIYYTLDGSVPNEYNTPYSEPFEITETTQINALSMWEDGTRSRVSSIHLTQVEPAPSVEAKTQPGLAYQYYLGSWEEMPDLKTLTPVRGGIVNAMDLRVARGAESDFGILFSGYLDIPDTGVYTLFVSSDDGSFLWVDGKKVIENDGIHGMREKKAVLALEAGLHPIALHYFQHLGGLGLEVTWMGPDMDRQAIDQIVLKH